MRENITKVSQRGERLDSLQDKTDNLAVSAQGFRRGANRVRKQMWWKDMKMRVCLVICVIILLVVIIVPCKSYVWCNGYIRPSGASDVGTSGTLTLIGSCRSNKALKGRDTMNVPCAKVVLFLFSPGNMGSCF